jgi:hypothetical protein
MNTTPREILLEDIAWNCWGTVELMKKYPVRNTECWQYVCDPMDEHHDADVFKQITCIEDTEYDPWFRKMIPWKWRSFEDGKGWHMGIPHMFLKGKKKYALAERYTTIEGGHLRLYKRVYDY